ncbi:MAG TPA: glycosyltransferase family 4 protein [Solirubrobacteraceae bacterium]|nr:glycosyltransferase family 4 protein [Solirubrobacteraceae bacterium]
MRSPSSLRVGLADVLDPRDVRAGSGASASLLRALEGLVAEVVPLSGALAPGVARAAHLASLGARVRPRDLRDPRGAARRAHSAAKLGRPTVAARTLLLRAGIARAGRLDAIVQRCSDMLLPAGARVVTLEDSTVVQALASYPWVHLRDLGERDVARYVTRQRRVYERAHACCCATHWVARSIVEDYGIARERVFTVGLGRNHELAPNPDRDWSEPRYLFVGVDWERKNGAAVLAAFARVRERHPQARLDLVGGHPPVRADGVLAHGPLSLDSREDRGRLADLYARATTFVMPSLHEPAGLVYAEAGAAGVPSIGTTDGGAATMIGPGGVLVDPREPEQLLQAMLELADPRTARRLGELAREHAAQLTWRKVAERLLRAMAIPGVELSGLAEFL